MVLKKLTSLLSIKLQEAELKTVLDQHESQ